MEKIESVFTCTGVGFRAGFISALHSLGSILGQGLVGSCCCCLEGSEGTQRCDAWSLTGNPHIQQAPGDMKLKVHENGRTSSRRAIKDSPVRVSVCVSCLE